MSSEKRQRTKTLPRAGSLAPSPLGFYNLPSKDKLVTRLSLATGLSLQLMKACRPSEMAGRGHWLGGQQFESGRWHYRGNVKEGSSELCFSQAVCVFGPRLCAHDHRICPPLHAGLPRGIRPLLVSACLSLAAQSLVTSS